MSQGKGKWSEARRVPQELYTRSKPDSDAGGKGLLSYGKMCRDYWKQGIVRSGQTVGPKTQSEHCMSALSNSSRVHLVTSEFIKS